MDTLISSTEYKILG